MRHAYLYTFVSRSLKTSETVSVKFNSMLCIGQMEKVYKPNSAFSYLAISYHILFFITL